MKSSPRGWMSLLLALLLANAIACGPAPSDDGPSVSPASSSQASSTSSTSTSGATPSTITLGTSQASVKSDNSDTATLTATVLDANSAVVEGIGVTFAATSGQLSTPTAVTDANGQAQVAFSSGLTDQSNRVATITASVAGIAPTQIPIQVQGSTLARTVDFTNLSVGGQEASLTITAFDAGGSPVYNARITLSASPAGVVSLAPGSGNTAVNGTLDVLVSGVAPGTTTVTAEGLGATVTQTFMVTTVLSAFGITAPADDPYDLDTDTDLTVTVSAPTQANVTFATTLGGWDGGGSVLTKAVGGGTASAVLRSSEAGLATVQVFDPADISTTDSLTVAISAPTSQASQISLQATSSVVAPSVGGVSNTVTLTANVRNASDQPVGGAPVSLEISNTTGGGESLLPALAFTDASGRAQTTFTSGSLPSDAQGVRVTATIVGTALSDFVDIVIGGTAGSVVIGQSTEIESIKPADTAYKLAMSVLVADGNGNAIPGAAVSLSLWPVTYSAGLFIDSDFFIFADFDNEDANRNLILDAGEDNNADGELTPPNSAAGTVPSTVTTDENGVANFDLVYLKASAVWIRDEITATTLVLGTETSATMVFRLPYMEGEEDNLPPSPYTAPVPVISLDPAAIVASTIAAADAPDEQFEVSNSGVGTITYTITDNVDWLSVSPAAGTVSGTASDTITISFDNVAEGLTPGIYTATITVTDAGAANSPQTVAVELTIN